MVSLLVLQIITDLSSFNHMRFEVLQGIQDRPMFSATTSKSAACGSEHEFIVRDDLPDQNWHWRQVPALWQIASFR